LLYITALRLEDGDLLIIPTAHDPDTAINDRVIGKFNDIDSCYVLDMSVARYR
jgi:hypothetical protein